jgi:hypothetical protein
LVITDQSLRELMVEVGNGLSVEEERSHFNLWALSKSPLLIGTHVLNSPLTILIIASFYFPGISGYPS